MSMKEYPQHADKLSTLRQPDFFCFTSQKQVKVSMIKTNAQNWKPFPIPATYFQQSDWISLPYVRHFFMQAGLALTDKSTPLQRGGL